MNRKITEIERNNAYVHKAMSAYRSGHCTYMEALEVAVIALDDANENLTDKCHQILMNSPATVIIGRGDYLPESKETEGI